MESDGSELTSKIETNSCVERRLTALGGGADWVKGWNDEAKGKKDSWTWTPVWWLQREGDIRGIIGNGKKRPWNCKTNTQNLSLTSTQWFPLMVRCLWVWYRGLNAVWKGRMLHLGKVLHSCYELISFHITGIIDGKWVENIFHNGWEIFTISHSKFYSAIFHLTKGYTFI